MLESNYSYYSSIRSVPKTFQMFSVGEISRDLADHGSVLMASCLRKSMATPSATVFATAL